MGNITHLYAENGKLVHVNVYALGEGISQEQDATVYGGGTVQVDVWSVTNLGSQGLGGATFATSPSTDGPDLTASASGKGHTELLGNSGVKYKLTARADDEHNYYFAKWTTSNSLSGNSWSEKDSHEQVDDYRECPWWGTCNDYYHNFYAVFLKWRWGYGFPCIVYANGGGKVSINGEESSASTSITTRTGLTQKKKDTPIQYKYYAHETEDKEFVGWYNNPTGSGEPLSTSLIYEASYIPTSVNKDQPSYVTEPLYAIFRTKLMGYTQPCEIKITGIGEISVDNTNWTSENIYQEVPPIGYVHHNSEANLSISYYARTSDETFTFDGWYNENGVKVSGDETYTYSYRPKAEIKEDLECPLALTAKFVPNNYFYNNYATVVTLKDDFGNISGEVYVDNGEKVSIDDIDEWAESGEYGDKSPINAYEFSYTYYARPIAGYAFKEWVIGDLDTDAEGNVTLQNEKRLSDEPVFRYTVDYTDENWLPGEENAFTLPTLYARFVVSRNYYHGRAQVGVAANSEEGTVYVSATETDINTISWYTPTDEQPFYTSDEAVVDNDDNGEVDNNIIETKLNQIKYNYYYYANPSSTATFAGWTAVQSGDNIVTKDNPYIPTYYAADIDNPHVPQPLYAVFRSYYHTLPRVVSIGSGKVKVNDHTNFQVEINSTEAIPAPAEGNYYAYTYTLSALADDGAQFLGWSTSDSEEDIVSTSPTYTINGRTTSTNRETPQRVTMYAIFESDIKIKHTDRMIYYQADGNEYINDVNVILEVANATTLTASLSGNTSDFILTNSNLTEEGTSITVDATQSIIPLRLMYVGEDNPLSNAINKQATLTFTSYDQNGNSLANNGKVITIEEIPVVTFLPADGKGSYSVSHTDGSGIHYTLGETDDQSVKIDVTHETKSYLQLDLTDKAADGMEFFAWQIIENYGTKDEKISYLSYEKFYAYHFTKSVTIRPEFIPEGWARYIIKSNPEVQYFELTKAIAQARIGVNPEEKIVVVYRDGLLPKGEYTIPDGVTLLVPGVGPGDAWGSTDYRCTTEALKAGGNGEDGDFLMDNYAASNVKCFRKLTVEDGTRINVASGGIICVYAKQIVYGNSYLTFPMRYGHLELGNDAVIDLQSGAKLFAWGYITNPENTKVTQHNYENVGRINAQKGSVVWETFSFRDFRGGTATIDFVDLGLLKYAEDLLGAFADQLKNANFYGYLHETFPINQYYVQNIEAPLMVHSGATENLVTAIAPSNSITVSSASFIGKNAGLFRWGESATATITKYYDAYSDRIKLIFEDTQAEKTSVQLGNIGLTLGVFGVDIELNSNDYVMPIQNNMDITAKNVKMVVPSGINLAFTAGATLYIDHNSTMVNNAQIYVYDNMQGVFAEGDGYVGSNDGCVYTIPHRPYGMKCNRSQAVSVNTNVDAKIIVDGLLDNTSGYFITTNDGANITSNGGGRIIVKNYGSPASGSDSRLNRRQSVYQYNQQPGTMNRSVGFHAIPLSTQDNKFYPKLHNANGTYTDATEVGTYYYCDGTWSANACSEEPVVELDYTPRFALTAPVISCYVGEGEKPYALQFQLLNEQLDQAAWGTVDWKISFSGRDANLFTFPEEQPAQPTIKFNPASEGVKTAVMHIKATYTHGGVDYIYTQAIDLIAEVKAQIANTLAFADFSTLYKGQQDVALWTDKNSNGAITIEVTGESGVISQPNVSTGLFDALKKGEVTVTVIQAADADLHIPACTIQTTIQVKPRVVWNWEELYYPSINTNPITMMDGTKGWTLEEVIDPESGDIVKFEGQGSTTANPNSTYTAEIFDLITGKFKVKFRFKQNGYPDEEFESIIYRDPRHLRVDVNNDTIFRGITVGKHENITYNKASKTVEFASPENENAVWTLYFIGVPDKLHFIPSSKLNENKAWQIEESTNGVTWTTTMPWQLLQSKQEFNYSLMPSTRYVRISYGVNGTGCLSDLYITELQGVRLDPQKLYMPAAANAQKHVALTYVSSSDVTISDPDELFTANPNRLSKTSDSEPYYFVEDVVITNNSCTEEELNNINIASSVGTVQLPIQTYKFPQQLPIVLASDYDERFYYVTTNTYNVEWNKESRTIQFHNAVATASPFVTFHYYGSPTYISFVIPEEMKGEWIIEESTDGTDWSTSHSSDRTVNNGLLKQLVQPSTTYIRVTYSSLYAENVNVTDLQIIGEKGAFASSPELEVVYESDTKNSTDFSITAINLEHGMTIETDNGAFTLSHGTNIGKQQNWELDKDDYAEVFANGAMEALDFKVYFDGSKAVDYSTITVRSIPGEGETSKVLCTIQVTGVRKTLTSGEINIYTGVPKDIKDGEGNVIVDVAKDYTLNGTFEGANYRKLYINNAFANSNALFDYLFIFGETTTADGTTTITTPTTIAGSNAKTPCYIYKKNGNAYEVSEIIENANSSIKISQEFLKLKDKDNSETVKVYITGFCPYASTGYTKKDEGIFFFQGGADDHVHVYLQDCYLYSRAKTENGHFFESRSDGYSFTENYVQGSGGVLVFECSEQDNAKPFYVTIHTRDNSLLKSHYGCFMESVAGRAFQPSSPVQIHLQSDAFETASKVELNFDDIWPKADTGEEEHTNGFLSLKKQVNNAPSIDMGNGNTVVNFNGGRIELENAQIVSDNYTTTMAISCRSGRFAGFKLAVGLGSDAYTGTVNFNDGTTTVEPMFVEERMRGYYVMDVDDPNTSKNESHYTSSIRVPANTFVFGGSHAKILACSPQEGGMSTGAYPKGKDKDDNIINLVPYKYPKSPEQGHKGGWNEGSYGLVKPTAAPEGYGIESVCPDDNGTPSDDSDDYLNFWVPVGYDDNAEDPRVEQKLSFWKACMTYIEAKFSLYGGHVGGDVVIGTDAEGKQTELVSNLLYCEIDPSIVQVISNNYSAPVKSPLPEGDPYLYVQPSKVGKTGVKDEIETQNYILNEGDYRVENKVYYITTATADIWTSFTAPFDVEKIYIMETRHEKDLDADAKELLSQGGAPNYLKAMQQIQARHNADFAAFFGVAMVIHPNKTFDQIFTDYKGWANEQDKEKGGNRRNKYELKHFYKTIDGDGNEVSNWNSADYYLYKNNGDWELDSDTEAYKTQWDFVIPTPDEPLMKQGDSYLMLFPYCVDCFEDGARDFWDYWTGKLLILESTDGPHTLHGSSFVGATANYEFKDENGSDLGNKVPQNVTWSFSDESGLISTLSERADDEGMSAAVSGNPTFALMETKDWNVLVYDDSQAQDEGFTYGVEEPEEGAELEGIVIQPTQSFLYTNIASVKPLVSRVLRDGTIVSSDDTNGNQNGTTGGRIPTVGGGNDLFVTSIAGGINVAVAAPQNVRVLSSTGAVIYSGYVTTAVDIQLPTTGIYIVSGENEVQKILF